MLGPRWLLACLLPLVTLQGALVAAKGIPVCAPGTQTCGLSGCYTPMFANCIQAQCFPKLLGERRRRRLVLDRRCMDAVMLDLGSKSGGACTLAARRRHVAQTLQTPRARARTPPHLP